MSLFRWFIIRQARRERLRTASTILGVAVGVAVVLAIRLANESSLRGFETALDAVSGRTSLEVTAPGVGVSDDRLGGLGWLREYGQVSPVIDGDAVLRPAGGGPTSELVRVLGVDILRDQPFRDYALAGNDPAQGEAASRPITTQEFFSLLTDPEAVVLTGAFATRHGIELEDRVELVTGDRVVPLVVRGLLGDDGPAQVRDGSFALMDIAAAQVALGRVGAVDRVDVRLHDSDTIDATEIEIAQRLPEGLLVQRPERRGAQVEKMLAAFHFNLSALSYIALLVGVFLVYNTVSVSVITRRSEIGMLRTVGASRGTVLGLFLGEAVALSLVGCVIGAPLAWVLARVAVGFTASTVSTFWVASAATVPSLAAGDVLLAFGIGVPLALIASVVPALEASRLTPVAVIRGERDLSIQERLPRRYGVGAAMLFLVGAWCATQPAVNGLPVFGLAAALAVVFGAALLVPILLHQVQRSGRWTRRWLPVEGRLAQSNIGASIRRVSISIAALAVSLAMMVAIAVMIGSFRETVVYWVGQTLQADLFVAAGRSGPLGTRATVSDDSERVIHGYPGVVAVDGFRSIDVPYGDSLIIVGSGRFDVMLEYGSLLFKAPEDGLAAMATAIGDDAVLVSESFSLRYDKGVDDVVALPTPNGDQDFRIAAVYFDYSSDRGLVVMDRPQFDAYYDDRRPSGLTVYLEQGQDADAVREELLAAVGTDRPLFINTNASLRRQVLEVFDSTFAITYALQGIAIVVSMFGVAATLLTLALERRRETAVLRLVGAERHHLRRMIMAEAGLLGLVSLCIGLVVGFVLSLILIFVINVQSFGWTIQFHVPFTFLVQTSLLVLVTTAVAGLYPAWVAGRLTMADLSGGRSADHGAA